MSLSFLFAVGIAGFVGAIARYYISEKWNKKEGHKLPYGTLTVNLAGSFFLGLLMGARLDELYIVLLGTGLLGAFTTFSTFNKELYTLQKNRSVWIVYFMCTYLGGLLLAYIGYQIGV